jgi:asparagine synthase (glutamine-hydrolysing)
MPGIVGLITRKPRQAAEAEVCQMVNSLRHESFYKSGVWSDESLGVYVGWIAQEGCFSDGMPVVNESGEVALVFSGEEYSDPETVRRLEQKGHNLGTATASYLVHAYEDDRAFPAGLNGMFHGLVADGKRGIAMLFNDRYGMRRLYYHQAKDGFYFAAEAKAILAVRPELRTPDPKSLGEFVACSCVLENRSIFKDIFLLPQASAWIFRNGAIEQNNTYFEPKTWEEQEPLEPESYYEELRGVLARNLPRYFRGHDRTAIALTGGLDTRVIMAWCNFPPGSLPCYTFGSMMRDTEDVLIARRVAARCQQQHEVIPVGKEFLSSFAHYANRTVYLTEGGVDVYRASDLYLSERARRIAPVKVVGTYGSEIIRHAVMLSPRNPADGLYSPDFLSYVHRAGNTCAELQREHSTTFVAFRQSPWYHYGILGLEQTQLTVRSPYLDNDFVRTAYRAPRAAETNDIRVKLIGDGNPELGRIRTDRGIGGQSQGVLSAALRSFLEFTFRAEYAYDYAMPQWLARLNHFCAPLQLENLFLGRHKSSHFRVWYRDALAPYVREILLDSRTLARPYLQPSGLKAIVEGHLRGNRNYTTEIHKLLTLELLQRRFFDAA